jgi:hypothetical protein
MIEDCSTIGYSLAPCIGKVLRRCTYQPATVVVDPEAGSEPDSGSLAYEMVELVGMLVASLKMATSPS